MRLTAIILASLVLSTGGATAADSPLFSQFQNLCISHDGAAAPALAAADAAGWMTMDSSMAPMPANGAFVMKSFQVRMNPTPGHVQLLVSGDGVTQSGAAPMNVAMCMVVSQPADPAAADMTKAWLGLAPSLSSPQLSVFIFGGGGGMPTHLVGSALQRALRDGSARMVMIPNVSDKVSMLMYAKPKPVV